MKLNLLEKLTTGFAGVAIVVTTGCAQPPAEQLDAATKAVESAQLAGAPEYAKEDFAKLEQQFTLAKDELAKQEKILSIFRSYSEANKMLIAVVQASGQVAAKAAQNKEAAKAAALTMEKENQQAVASAKELIGKAPSGKDRAAVKAIEQDLAGLDTSLSAMHQLIEKGDYFGAETQGKALKEKAAQVSGEIQAAIEKTKEKKPTVRS